MAKATAQKAPDSYLLGVPGLRKEPFPIKWPTRAVAFLLAGYLFFDKAFAYLHVPGTPLFIGELVIAIVVVYLLWSRPRTEITKSAAGFVLLLFVLFSLTRTLPYISEFGIDALRDAAIWYYAVFAVFAVAAVNHWGVDRVVGWYGRLQFPYVVWAPLAMVLAAAVTRPFVPDTNISIFEHSVANLSVMLCAAILYFWLVDRPQEPRQVVRRAVITGGSALIIVVSGIANRGGLVSVMVGLLIAALLTRAASQRRFISIMGATLAIVLAVALILDVRAEVFSNQREVSVRQLVENVVSLTGRGTGVVQEDLGGTASWRLTFWEAIIDDVTSNHLLSGLGYGENIADRYGYVGDAQGFRSAHNSHMSIFGRSGFIGLTLWSLMWWAWFYGLLRARRRLIARQAGQRADICSWLIAVASVLLLNAVFDPTFETPTVGAWLWTIFGVGIALTQSARFRSTSDFDSGVGVA